MTSHPIWGEWCERKSCALKGPKKLKVLRTPWMERVKRKGFRPKLAALPWSKMFAVRSQGKRCGNNPLDDEESKWEVRILVTNCAVTNGGNFIRGQKIKLSGILVATAGCRGFPRPTQFLFFSPQACWENDLVPAVVNSHDEIACRSANKENWDKCFGIKQFL